MYKLFIIISILCSPFAFAQSSYQVDLIIFSHQQSADKNIQLATNSFLIPVTQHAISLQPSGGSTSKPYTLLSPTQSSLRDEYYLLSRKSHFKVLSHYSWRQPANSQSIVALPNALHDGWQMAGTVRVRQSNYYLFDADIQLSPPNNPQGAFSVVQKQRLKGNMIYFLDHPQVGMLVKVHKLA